MTVFKDGRLPPFAWVSRAAAGVLLEEFEGRERSMALSIYLALSLLSSEQRRGDHDGIIATRKQVAEAAGVSDRTVDAYTDRLAQVGLLVVTRRREGQLNLANVWTLVEPARGGELGSLPPSASPGVANQVREGGEAHDTPFKEEGEEKKDPVSSETGSLESEASRHPEALRLSRLLASLIQANDAKAKVTPEKDSWVRDVRLLLADRDGDVAVVEFVLRWSQADPFWRSNILSPGKLRKHFPRLLLKATGERDRRGGVSSVSSAEARARIERTARRLGMSVEAFLSLSNHPPTPIESGGNDGNNRRHLGAPQQQAGAGRR